MGLPFLSCPYPLKREKSPPALAPWLIVPGRLGGEYMKSSTQEGHGSLHRWGNDQGKLQINEALRSTKTVPLRPLRPLFSVPAACLAHLPDCMDLRLCGWRTHTPQLRETPCIFPPYLATKSPVNCFHCASPSNLGEPQPLGSQSAPSWRAPSAGAGRAGSAAAWSQSWARHVNQSDSPPTPEPP